MAGSRVTLASLDEKLDGFMQQVFKHMEQDAKLFERIAYVLDGNGKPGLKTRIELTEKDVEDLKASRGRQIKAIWSTFVVVVGAIITSFFVRH